MRTGHCLGLGSASMEGNAAESSVLSVFVSVIISCNLCLGFAISASFEAISLSCFARHSQLFHHTSLICALL